MKSNQNVLCVLYDDPIGGMPSSYPRGDLPEITGYPDGQTLPSPHGIDYTPGHLLGSVSGALGLTGFLEKNGHTFTVTADKDGSDSVFEKHLPQANVVISQPFWPAYLTQERIAKAQNLQLAITAGVGSDHVDLQAAMAHGITVCEVTFSNCICVAEHTMMMILNMVRDFIPQHVFAANGGWNIADCVKRSYDLEGMHVGCLGAGRIGLALLKRLKPFGVHLHYSQRHRLPQNIEAELLLTFHDNVESLARVCDVLSIHCPLVPETEHLFNDVLISKMKRGSYIVNTARGKICQADAIVRALNSGQLAGYAGDVWFPQPAPKNHPWRTMPHNAMTPHTSGTSLPGQARYAAGVREILECWFADKPIRNEYLIVENGQLAGTGAQSYTAGNTTSGAP